MGHLPIFDVEYYFSFLYGYICLVIKFFSFFLFGTHDSFESCIWSDHRQQNAYMYLAFKRCLSLSQLFNPASSRWDCPPVNTESVRPTGTLSMSSSSGQLLKLKYTGYNFDTLLCVVLQSTSLLYNSLFCNLPRHAMPCAMPCSAIHITSQ